MARILKRDKNFAFQRVKLDTWLIAIQDVRKNVRFEGFYSSITEGITIERKIRMSFFIPYADLPENFHFLRPTTLYPMSDTAKRRQKNSRI